MDKSDFKIRFVANNNETRSKGLMFAQPLEEDETAFFIFPYSDRFGFWNKNVSFRLSLAFLDDNHKIVDIKDLEAESSDLVVPDHEARYVVEASAGVFDKLNIKCGDYLIYNSTENKLKTIKAC